MKTVVCVLLFAASVALSAAGPFDSMFRTLRPRASAQTQTDAVQGLMVRLLGQDKGARFNVTVDEAVMQQGKDTFTLSKMAGEEQVRVVGSSGVAAAWGLAHYLKTYCGCHVSWDGDQLALPQALPDVDVTVVSLDRVRYYQNVCTSSYSFVWWDWGRWEREIDWMALTGINMALAFTAQEAIWQRVYDGLGLAQNDFTGPAFLAWLRMGNMRVFGGGLTASWHDRSIALQHRILQRMRELGITTVLPAFAGPVPKSFTETYPQAQVSNVSRWNSFSDEHCCPYLLDPSDPLFQIIARVFLREYTEEFGTNHVYNCDTFNENTPVSDDPEYLAATAEAIFNGIEEVDPNGVWMLQGWMFHYPFWGVEQARAYLSRIPVGRLLILDLQSDLTPQYERLESFFGHAFIWCTLHNFGGQLGLYGHLEKVNSGVVQGRKFVNSTMVGLGITPEGIDQNYIMYEFTLDSVLRDDVANLTQWVSGFAMRRYAISNAQLDAAWQILKDTAYSYDEDFARAIGTARRNRPSPYSSNTARNIMTKLPSPSMSEMTWYNRTVILDVLTNFLEASKVEQVSASELFRHDLVDVARQTIQFAVSLLYKQLMADYKGQDVAAFRNSSAQFLQILDELTLILNSDRKFLLGPWLESAKNCATTDEERVQYEYNARNQITLWGPNGEIRDYAAKHWSGLVEDYYRPRWAVFITALDNVLMGGGSYNDTAVKAAIFSGVEQPFTMANKTYPINPSGDAIATITAFYSKWQGLLQDIFTNSRLNRKLLGTEFSVISV